MRNILRSECKQKLGCRAMAISTVVCTPSAHTSGQCQKSLPMRALGVREDGPARRCVEYCWSWPGYSTQVDFKTIRFNALLIKLPSKAIWVTFLSSILSFSLCKCNYHGDNFKQSDLEFSRRTGLWLLGKLSEAEKGFRARTGLDWQLDSHCCCRRC